ncbi:MAG: 50S ribosomal protein L2 [Candidatus Collierbacteria bacterium GW2011_GWB1_45_35]|uniref:Large ribosomal subunit protein uL2 n=2 Tax=Candidatus Collieribacteriota TaxID=1752725 RepID=A0A0G1KPW8_9BACT|nr:MAG: 50S ribosomal protein L2 [Microgenomates group bacterium GW2011_GWC1_44_23]KKT85686.1 MAG: 50S ribosomal protein L2 [Candidatus Collierbacteria bacterium GW2011_GWA2_44_99]KKT96169.1 MAG: 50S ribosomal protein L2 [Candidatus Collierbacteria bacterium GW2011_GWA1_45_15]KKU01209.1 MAG: 50S ribosomal protein L2 [Candidatus Collierbacteria bacterium GW2011_GWB2_45_17]KKU05364.1 MAG: 50S ribosomal protein L2 [Candidatus Collierbacteria bacterium GW2011_GWB1_45_35]KKU08511.1 MAG: 50S ribosom
MKTIPKKLIKLNPKSSGRNSSGKITVRHQGGREKRFLRHIDWKRNLALTARVESIQYDPNRTSDIALLVYVSGIKDYILAPQGLKVGDTVISSEAAEIKVGNCLPLKNIPIGIEIHNLEIVPGKGAQMVRSAGNTATVQSKEGNVVVVKLPSGEIRQFDGTCKATIGALSNPHHKEEILGKAGRKRHMGVRPTVRGVAQDPRSHPHGGGEGRSGIGMKSPKSPWGKRTLGKRTRDRKKYSNKLIIKRRYVK